MKLMVWIGILVFCIMFWVGVIKCFAQDITIKNIPDGISTEQVQEWVGILVERFQSAKINQIPEVKTATDNAQAAIDTYRKANLLKPKFEKVETQPQG